MAAGRGDIDRVGEMIAVEIISLARGDHRMREGGHDIVPTHMRDAQAGLRVERAQASAIELELAATAAFLAREGQADPWGETARRKPEKAAE